MNNNLSNITAIQLREAAEIKDQIDRLETELVAILSGGTPPVPGKRTGRKPGSKNKPLESAASAPTAKKKGGKRKMSPEGRARIVAAQKARWAKIKKSK
ncbi:MAG: hypothetical protein R3F19_12265 [Verrucomicrobiales bacterium]